MTFLLDTCVISELTKIKPNSQVINWINSCSEETLFLSAITIGEIPKGISKLPDSQKRNTLNKWLNQELIPRFQTRILNIDIDIALTWGEIIATTEKQGNKMPAIDSLIVATAIIYHKTLVTRNIKDMKNSAVKIYNPWE